MGTLTERAMPLILEIPLTIERMAHDVAGDKHLLSALPTGMGKTTALAITIRQMLDDPAYRGVGIVILVNQLNLIRPLLKRIGLADNDPRFAIRTRRKELNQLGIGDEAATQQLAQVFITTQQKLNHLTQQAWHRDFAKDAFYQFNRS
jgi:hypothetical protein